jgi:hypothetical protein
MHFVGTTYASKAEGLYQVLPIARECGVDDIVEERPGRVQHLDAIQILLDSDALVLCSRLTALWLPDFFIYPAAKPLLYIS